MKETQKKFVHFYDDFLAHPLKDGRVREADYVRAIEIWNGLELVRCQHELTVSSLLGILREGTAASIDLFDIGPGCGRLAARLVEAAQSEGVEVRLSLVDKFKGCLQRASARIQDHTGATCETIVADAFDLGFYEALFEDGRLKVATDRTVVFSFSSILHECLPRPRYTLLRKILGYGAQLIVTELEAGYSEPGLNGLERDQEVRRFFGALISALIDESGNTPENGECIRNLLIAEAHEILVSKTGHSVNNHFTLHRFQADLAKQKMQLSDPHVGQLAPGVTGFSVTVSPDFSNLPWRCVELGR